MTKSKKRTDSIRQLTEGRLKRCFGEYRMEIERYSDRKKIFLVSGVKTVLTYTTEEVALDMGGERLTINGKSLLCRTYISGSVEIIGEVDGVSLGISPVTVGSHENP